MEDEDVVKAPVTRLRRRLSVEQSEDSKSSSAPNTPTKKRGGRKAAKPELDLIDENGIESSTPKILTKKNNMKDVESDEKPVTPSRRSARIKSNTSVVLETTLSIDSPRAKRATRRTSQVGSDNEAPLTPVMQTRRIRKNSTNADKAEPQSVTKPKTDVIVEEPEIPSQKSQNIAEKPVERNQPPTVLRKSPRLSLKKNKHNDSVEANEKEDESKVIVNKKNKDSMTSEIEINTSADQNNSNKENIMTEKEVSKNVLPQTKDNDDVENNRLSITSTELLKEINCEPNKIYQKLNKSTSAIVDTHGQLQRHRSKSSSTLSSALENEDKYYSDSETIKKKKRLLNKPVNSKAENLSANLENIEHNLNISVCKKGISMHDISTKEIESVSTGSPNRNANLLSPSAANSPNKSTVIDMFTKKPANDMQVLLYIEESDSSLEKIATGKQVEDEDQCVPIVITQSVIQQTPPQTEIKENNFNFNQENKEPYAVNKSINKNDSCEPMDIDETIPDDVVVNISVSKTLDVSKNRTISEEKRKSNCSINEKDANRRSPVNTSQTLDKTANENKSTLVLEKRKLNCSINEKDANRRSPVNTSQTLDKTANENKSTLVLSQLKDISNDNNEPYSPQSVTKNNLPISLNVSQDNEGDKNNLVKNYSTSTPLQQKSLLRHIQVNTSGINSTNTSKIEKSLDTSKLKKSNANISKSSAEQPESENESSEEENSFVNDEAEEANDDYESGDSKDEEEEQYERENEVVEKGETLTSEDNISNDTDFENDSFLVSSDEEDNTLLDGSGDDLSMSDNELKMTAKSKKKYDERKIKEQKMASRQMFESRHKLNLSNKSNKSEKTKIKKKRTVLHSSDSEDEVIENKKKKRMRLDSSEVITSDDKSESKINTSLSKSLTSEGKNIQQQIKIVNTSIPSVDPQHSERIESDGTRTQINVTQANDPLDNENLLTSSDSSDNVHIENYDSILNELNKSMKTKKDKKGDVSLNLDKKIKKKSVAIVDQLNLTAVKTNNLKKKKHVDSTLENKPNYLNDESEKSVTNMVDNQDIDMETSEEEMTISKNNKSEIDKSNQSLSRKRSCNQQSDIETTEDEETISITNKSINDKLNQPLAMRLCKKHDDSGSSEDEVTMNKNNKSLDYKLNLPLSSRVSNKPDKDESSEDEVIMDKNNKSLDDKSNKSLTKTKHSNKPDDNESSDDEVTMDKNKKSLDHKLSQPLSKRASNKHGKKVLSKDEVIKEKNSETLSDIVKKTVSNIQSIDKESVNGSSSSIDLHLLFSGDSNNSDDVQVTDKKDDVSKEDNNFIPLKISHGEINKLETSRSKDSSQLESSKKKKMKRDKNEDKSTDENQNSFGDTEVHFFLDTTGTHCSTAVDNSLDTSKSSASKKKKGKCMIIEDADKNSDTEAPMEVSNNSMEEAQEKVVILETSLVAANKSISKTPKSDKKKKRISVTETTLETGTEDKSMNKSMTKTPQSEKSKTKKISELQGEEQIYKNSDTEAPMEVSNKSMEEAQENQVVILETSLVAANKSISKTPKSDKKKKRTSVTETTLETGTEDKSMNKSMTKTPKSEMSKTKRISESQAEEQIYEQDPGETMDVKNTSIVSNKSGSTANRSLTKCPSSEKKESKIISQSEDTENIGSKDSSQLESSKKKKMKRNKNVDKSTDENQNSSGDTEVHFFLDTTGTHCSTAVDNSLDTAKSSASKKKNGKCMIIEDAGNTSETKEETVNSKKRKRKSSLNQTEKKLEVDETVPKNSSQNNFETSAVINQNKKRKISHKSDDPENFEQAPQTKMQKAVIEKQDQFIKNQPSHLQSQMDNTGINLITKKGIKKRKEREEDEGFKTAKVLKLDTCNKTQVLRLPSNILNKLDDKPKKRNVEVTKYKAISTSNFTVEGTKVKKTKPSHYLEESIYLNEEDVSESKKQKHIKNPKVLPFLPTVSTSSSGYTTNFTVNILPKEIKFVAKSSHVNNFKNDYLENKKIKRLGTYDLYKRNRNLKMSKF